jgi:6-phosphogluconolactonase (cycloisomerase 2 family)
VSVSPPSIVPGLYVANRGANSVTVYAPGVSGNATPLRIISGADTKLFGTRGVALDSTGNLYVSNEYGNITVYAPGASDNVAPIRTIHTSGWAYTGEGLDSFGMVLDSAGNLYVSNDNFNSITVYAPDATGNATPLRTIRGPSTGLFYPEGVALDSAGNLYVANFEGNTITVYAPGATGDVAPIRSISGALPPAPYMTTGVALDFAGNLYVSNSYGNSITVYASAASGKVAPIRTIRGENTGLNYAMGVALDATGNLYVSNFKSNTITVYAPGANGNIPPFNTISGASTGLSGPSLIVLRP